MKKTAILLSIFSIFMISCTQNIFHNSGTGELSITLPYGNLNSAKQINADTSNQSSIVYNFKVSITSANGTALKKEGKSGETIAFSDLATGDYEVSVDGYFTDDFLVFTGKEKASVKTGQQTPVKVNMKKYDASKMTHIDVTPDENLGINVNVTMPDVLSNLNYCYIEELKTGIRVDAFKNRDSIKDEVFSFNYPFTNKNIYYGFTLHYELQNQKEFTEYVYCIANGGDTTSLKRSGIISSSDSDTTVEKTEDSNTTSLKIKINSDILDIVPDDSESSILTRNLDIILLRGEETYYTESKKDKLLTNIKTLSSDDPEYQTFMSTGIDFGPDGVDEYKEILEDKNTIDRLIAGYNKCTAVVQGYFNLDKTTFSLPPIVKTFESDLGKEYSGYLNIFNDYVTMGNTSVICKAIYHSPSIDKQPSIITVEDFDTKELTRDGTSIIDYDPNNASTAGNTYCTCKIAKIKFDNVVDEKNILSLSAGIFLDWDQSIESTYILHCIAPLTVDFTSVESISIPYDYSNESVSLKEMSSAISAKENFVPTEDVPYPTTASIIQVTNSQKSKIKLTIEPKQKGTYLMIFGQQKN